MLMVKLSEVKSFLEDLTEWDDRQFKSDAFSVLLEQLKQGETLAEEIPLLAIGKCFGLKWGMAASVLVSGHDQALRYFACQGAEMALGLFNLWFPGDERLGGLLETAKKFSLGEISAVKFDKAKKLYKTIYKSIHHDEKMSDYKFDEIIYVLDSVNYCLGDLRSNKDSMFNHHTNICTSIEYYIKNVITIEDTIANKNLADIDPLQSVLTSYANVKYLDSFKGKFKNIFSPFVEKINSEIIEKLSYNNIFTDKTDMNDELIGAIYSFYLSKIVNSLSNCIASNYISELFNELIKFCNLNDEYKEIIG
ncbi:MAG: hypothetical protein LBR11_12585 [Deltaproteobacteria bacterium]|jgi:hypothetical protein|nr:hypothetical protein [Deltaproteobacteria bacterium]